MADTTIAQLEQAYPDLIAQVRAAAVSAERERVALHVDFGRRTGALGMGLALQHIASGAPLAESAIAGYYDAAARERAMAARQDDSDDAGRILAGARVGGNAASSELAREIDRQMGVTQ